MHAIKHIPTESPNQAVSKSSKAGRAGIRALGRKLVGVGKTGGSEEPAIGVAHPNPEYGVWLHDPILGSVGDPMLCSVRLLEVCPTIDIVRTVIQADNVLGQNSSQGECMKGEESQV